MLGWRIEREQRGCPDPAEKERVRKEEEWPAVEERGSRRSVLPCNLLTAGPRLSISWHNSGMGPSDPENVTSSRGTRCGQEFRLTSTLRRFRAIRISRVFSFLNGRRIISRSVGAGSLVRRRANFTSFVLSSSGRKEDFSRRGRTPLEQNHHTPISSVAFRRTSGLPWTIPRDK